MCKLYFLHYCPAWLLNAWILLVMYLQLSAIRQIENNYVLTLVYSLYDPAYPVHPAKERGNSKHQSAGFYLKCKP